MSRMFCLAAAFAVVSGSASAMTITATFTGTMFNSYDTTGIFGAAGSSLDGQTVIAAFVFDPNLPGVHRATTATSDELDGGTLYGSPPVPSPLVAATVKINGISRNVAGGFYSYIGLSNTDYFGATAQALDPVGQYIIDMVDVYGFAPGLPNSLDADFSLSAAQFSNSIGTVYFTTYDANGNPEQFSTGGQFTLTSAVFNAGGPPAVPLPASLPLMASALAGVAALRRRRAA